MELSILATNRQLKELQTLVRTDCAESPENTGAAESDAP
jgi:hypothetical protein